MKQKYEVEVKEFGLKFSTGSLAKQANGSVLVNVGGTSVLVTAVVSHRAAPGQNFFPLIVDYREKFSAAGRMPGGYGKREGKPSEKEILTARMCDRPLRPLFQKGFLNEVQIIGTLFSTDMKNEADILMVNGASAALMCSDIPWAGPIACVRIAEIKGRFVANPTNEQILQSTLDLVYVGNENDLMMIEGNADQITEERFCEALEFGQTQIQPIVAAQRELAAMVGKQKKIFALNLVDPKIIAICSKFNDELNSAVFREGKIERESAIDDIKLRATEAAIAELGSDNVCCTQIDMAFDELQEKLYRDNILELGKRVDGRSLAEIRHIECEVAVLPIVHGSALFQRGETQALVSLTLGCARDSQEIDAITGGVQSKSFYLHYNFPPFSVGETGKIGSVGRREIGHGVLAERSLLPVIPGEDKFPYTIRVVSDILESNGSSSMASVCGACLALMDAGVPIANMVAGISIGLVTKNEGGKIVKSVLLTDIIGTEDHFGDMDFKLSGTKNGITGIQLDLKIFGLPLELVKQAIYQSRDARMVILDKMSAVQSEPRKELNENAPRMHAMQINPSKIGALIGPGGKNIKHITEMTGAKIDINGNNSGSVLVYANNQETLDCAISEINSLISEIEPNKVYRGIVKSIREFGAFIECIPGQEGLAHVSELADFHVENPEDICKVGDEIIVKCIGKDEKGRVRLSRRAVICEAKGIPYVATTPKSSSGGRGGSRPFGGGRPSRGGDRGQSRGGDGGHQRYSEHRDDRRRRSF